MQVEQNVRRLADWDAQSLRALADEHGTPLYIYDLDRIRENATRLTTTFDQERVSYAVKANTSRPVLETIADAGVGAECASAGEVKRALDAGFSAESVRYTAVNPPGRDLAYVLDQMTDGGPVITVGAGDTLERLDERGFDGRLFVRINPGVGAGHHEKVSTGAEPKFGVPYDRAAEFVAEARDRGFAVDGLHAHAGSGINSEDGLAAHRTLVSRMGDLAREVGDLEAVNVGGGLGVPYRPEDSPLDIDAVAVATRDAIGSLDATLGIEPGRYFVADAGVLLTTVNTVKPTPETLVAGVDCGMTTLIRPALYGAYHELRNLASDASDRDTAAVTVSGPICETADVLARDREITRPERGDVLAVGNAGAYGYEMASQYNSRPRPAVVVRDGTETRLAVRRERLDDITRLEQW
jgi:diaminopimelate decarboxylase